MTTTHKGLSPGELMAWVQAQRRCPICREEQCDCWQALAAVPALLEALERTTALHRGHQCTFHGPSICDKCQAIKLAERAIAQATKEIL